MPARTASELAAYADRSRRLLAVFPHPDDESYGPAAALARTARHGDGAAAYLCLTRGEASSLGRERGLSPEEVAALREERLLRVAEILPLQGLVIRDFPDGGLAFRPLDEVAASIGEVLDAFRPQVVIGHDPRGVNGHLDHVAAHWALRHALLTRPEIRLAMVAYTPDIVEELKPRLMFPTPVEAVDVEIVMTDEEAEAKEAVLRVHDALITVRDDAPPELIRRPRVERFSWLRDTHGPPAPDLF
ncbi:MAG: hypothetical protein HKN12_03730 [Gemmatimonadetes bacterium]|nr:hypothetical protein [Gemmatimonadota bacterium]